MIERIFKLIENKTSVRVELLAGVTTFLTMSYIIVVQRCSLEKCSVRILAWISAQ